MSSYVVGNVEEFLQKLSSLCTEYDLFVLPLKVVNLSENETYAISVLRNGKDQLVADIDYNYYNSEYEVDRIHGEENY